MQDIQLKISGMHCASCASRLQRVLNQQQNTEASVNFATEQATIKTSKTLEEIISIIKKTGYDTQQQSSFEDKKAYFLLFLSLILITIAMLPMFLNIETGIISVALQATLALLIMFLGREILISGIKSLAILSPNMFALVFVGTLSAFALSVFNFFSGSDHLYFETSGAIVAFVYFGKFLEQKTKKMMLNSLNDLSDLLPEEASVLKDGKITKINVKNLQVNDILLVAKGERFAVDGLIVDGNTEVDESLITGESTPIFKQLNNAVIAGSINLMHPVHIKTLQIKDSKINQLRNLVLNAQNTKPKVNRYADQITSIFVPSVFVAAFASFVFWFFIKDKSLDESLQFFVSVLIVACPCALGLAVPISIFKASTLAFKNGILVKQGELFEVASKIQTIIFDKTGTLTTGKMQVQKAQFNGDIEQAKNIALTLSQNSNHPTSIAIKQYCNDAQTLVAQSTELAALGLIGEIDGNKYFLGNQKLLENNNVDTGSIQTYQENTSISFLADEQNILATFFIADTLRDESVEVMSKLSKSYNVLMLTGDRQNNAQYIADKLNISYKAQMTPEDKMQIVAELAKTQNILMVGDGINDAPALSHANIGVTLSSGTDIAVGNSDCLLLKDNLSSLVDFLSLSKNTMVNIKQNLFWALIYNVIFIPFAAGAFNLQLNPMVASILMCLSSISVIANAMRLKV